MNKNVVLEQEWDKTFKLDENVNHEKVVFHNRFCIDLVGDLYSPKNISEDKLPALEYGQCYGYVPALALGGKASNKNLQVVDAKSYIDIIGQAVGKIIDLGY